MTEKDNKQDGVSALHVLVVDDCDTTRALLVEVLHKRGISHDAVASTVEALSVLKAGKQAYDACLIDYALEDMQGLDLVHKIREDRALDGLALLMISGGMKHRDYDRMEKIGLDGFFNKPFKAEQIIEGLSITSARRKTQEKGGEFITRHNVDDVMQGKQPSRRKVYAQYPDTWALAVDDMNMNMLLIKKVLGKFGVQVEAAMNGREALEAFREKEYDIIFMDCQMPEMDGFEATAQIRLLEDDNSRMAVPIVALTADTMPGNREKCLDCGMNDYINKPFLEEDIARVLRSWLGEKPTGSE